MLKKIVSLILITISSFFIINNFKEVKDYDDNVDLLIEKNRGVNMSCNNIHSP